MTAKQSATKHPNGYFSADACYLDDFIEVVTAPNPKDVVYAAAVENGVAIYNGLQISTMLGDEVKRFELMAEWAEILRFGGGAFVIRNTYSDLSAIDSATQIYNRIIAEEKSADGGRADHFAKAGNNDRVWNSLQKLCEQDPDVFVHYFGNPLIQAACEAWLGPNYQMTAQINLVRPGGEAQLAHRDYHLGFQTADISAQYPAHVHDLSPVLTLQGAIAHTDMPIESGPTKLLPGSQRYRPGYAAWRKPEFRAYFEDNFVQLPLAKGDTLYFNPALFHGAGANVSADIQRMANLIQISSAFGRAMETIDRQKMCRLIYPCLLRSMDGTALSAGARRAAIAASAEGYSFPTNLDTDPPIGGLAPETQAALMERALSANMPETEFNAALDNLIARQQA